jgi:hypothetical protein
VRYERTPAAYALGYAGLAAADAAEGGTRPPEQDSAQSSAPTHATPRNISSVEHFVRGASGEELPGKSTPSTSILEIKFATSRWWEATGDPTSLLTTWTQNLGVQHLVMGHQPQAVAILGGTDRPQDVMAAEYGGLLFFVDTCCPTDRSGRCSFGGGSSSSHGSRRVSHGCAHRDPWKDPERSSPVIRHP